MPRRHPHPLDHPLAAAAAGWTLLGAIVAVLTARINPHLHADLGDALVLLLYGLGVFGAVGVLLGAVVEIALRLVRRIPRFPEGRLRRLAGAILLGAPLGYALLLPDLGLFPRLLTDARGGAGGMLLALLVMAAPMVGAWLALSAAWASGRRVARGLGAAWTVLLAAALLVLVAGRPVTLASPVREAPWADLASPSARPVPVVLLCIDGADLDDVVLPMVERGRLPTFARLLREGAWGPLATLEPTLSPVVWTSLITGKPPAAHGIWHFVHVRLPGIDEPIGHFPVHTGLNFQLFPRLADLGLPPLQAPTTSSMRRVRTLWEIVGERHPVGNHRWLMSWPAEPFHGFSVAGGPAWIDYTAAGRGGSGAVHPPELRRELAAPPRAVTPEEYEPYLGPGSRLDPGSAAGLTIRRSLRDRTSERLPELIARYGAVFTASAFYPVDAYHHLFARDRGTGGPFAPGVGAAYEHTDRRLGELLGALPEPRNLIVISDHGFDFAHGHHTWSPPGLFVAHGPAFRSGGPIRGLSVYDVAPLVLHLLDFPLAEDMPGTTRGAWHVTLRDPPVEPAPTVASYEGGQTDGPPGSTEATRDEELERVLESLGYVN